MQCPSPLPPPPSPPWGQQGRGSAEGRGEGDFTGRFGAPRCTTKGGEEDLGADGAAKQRSTDRHSPEAWFYCVVLFFLNEIPEAVVHYTQSQDRTLLPGWGRELGVGNSHLSRHVSLQGLPQIPPPQTSQAPKKPDL